MRADLRLSDLHRDKAAAGKSKLMNVKISANLSAAIDRVAEETGATKTAVVIALFNEGLEIAEKSLKGWKRPRQASVPAERQCAQGECKRQVVAKGLCAAHYQQSRRGPIVKK